MSGPSIGVASGTHVTVPAKVSSCTATIVATTHHENQVVHTTMSCDATATLLQKPHMKCVRTLALTTSTGTHTYSNICSGAAAAFVQCLEKARSNKDKNACSLSHLYMKHYGAKAIVTSRKKWCK